MKEVAIFASRGKIVFSSVWVRVCVRFGVRLRVKVRAWIGVKVRAILALEAK